MLVLFYNFTQTKQKAQAYIYIYPLFKEKSTYLLKINKFIGTRTPPGYINAQKCTGSY